MPDKLVSLALKRVDLQRRVMQLRNLQLNALPVEKELRQAEVQLKKVNSAYGVECRKVMRRSVNGKLDTHV